MFNVANFGGRGTRGLLKGQKLSIERLKSHFSGYFFKCLGWEKAFKSVISYIHCTLDLVGDMDASDETVFHKNILRLVLCFGFQ